MTDFLATLSRTRWCCLLLGAAVVTRLVWVIALPHREPRFDERHYISHAARLAEDKGYVDDSGRPTAYWPIGYPALLSIAYRAVGNAPRTAVLVQLVLGTATCLVVGVAGGLAFGPRIGRPAALLVAVYPTHVFYTTLHLTEPLFTLLFVAAVALLLGSLVRGPVLGIVAGFTIGLAALARPAILLMPLVLPAWYWLQGWPRRRTLVTTALAGCCTLLAVSPWLVRNHGLTGSWFVISTTGGHNFWIGNHPDAFGGYVYPKEINEALRDGSGYDYSRGYRLGLDAIAASPLRAALRVVQKVSYFFAVETDGVLWNLKGLAQPPPMTVTLALLGAASAAYLFVLGFAVLGLIGTPWTSPLASLLLLLTCYMVLVTAVFLGDPRYHYALVPLAAIFSAKGFLEDRPALLKAVRAGDRAGVRRLLAWGALVAVSLALMAGNVLLKLLESRSLVR